MPSSELAMRIEPAAMNYKDTARYCGFSVSHLFNLVKTGRFAPVPVRMGRCVRFLRADVDRWLNDGCPNRERFRPNELGREKGDGK